MHLGTTHSATRVCQEGFAKDPRGDVPNHFSLEEMVQVLLQLPHAPTGIPYVVEMHSQHTAVDGVGREARFG